MKNIDNRYLILLLFYLIFISIFKYIKNSFYRFLLITLLALLSLYIFKINKKNILIYILLTFFAILTEIIFIKYFYKTWFYYKKELIVIPFWLISLWFCAIVFIIEIYKILI